MKVSSGVVSSKLNVLIYADPGVGKTFFAATAMDNPVCGNVLFLDIDKGLTSISHYGDRVKHVPIDSTVEFEQAIKDLAGPDRDKYQTIVVDSLTELSELEIQAIAKAATEKAGARRDNPDFVELVDHKIRGQRLVRLFGLVKRLPQNIIFLAKAAREMPKDSEGQYIAGAKPLEIYPDLPKKVRGEVLGMMDIAGYLHKEADKTRKLYLEATGPIKAKSRVQGVDGVLTNPTMKDIFKSKGSK